MKTKRSFILVFIITVILGELLYQLLYGYSGRTYLYAPHVMMMPLFMMIGILVLIVISVVALLVLFKQPDNIHNQAMQVLKTRLANGDITSQEYDRIYKELKED